MNTGELRPSAAVVIRHANHGYVLWQRRKATAECGGMWEIPGGHVEWGEQSEQAAAREVKEELGIEVTDLRLIDVIGHTVPSGAWYCCAVFEAVSDGTIPPPAERESQEVKWVRPEACPDGAAPMSTLAWERWVGRLTPVKGSTDDS